MVVALLGVLQFIYVVREAVYGGEDFRELLLDNADAVIDALSWCHSCRTATMGSMREAR